MPVQPFWYAAVFILGLVFGSFFNVAIYRWPQEDPRKREWVKTPSHCPQCGARIRWYDNVPLLSFIRGAKLAENSLDYSLQNTTRNALYLPTSREAKYKAKQANDTFFVRFGDVLSAGLVFAGTTWLGFAPREFALANVALIVVWLVLAIAIGRLFKKLAGTA